MHGFYNLRSVMSICEDKRTMRHHQKYSEYNQVCLPFHEKLLANPKLISVFSLILSLIGKINFQTGKAILYKLNF